MLSTTGYSETATSSKTATAILPFSFLLIAVPLFMVSLGCSEQRDVVPDEPRLSTAYHDDNSHANSHAASARDESRRQDPARSWLLDRQRAADAHAAMARHDFDYETGGGYDGSAQYENDIGGVHGDYRVVEDPDVFQSRLYPTLKF